MPEEKITELQCGFNTAFIDGSYNSNLAYKPQFIYNDNKNGQKLWKKCKCLFLNGRCCLKDGNDKTHNQGRSQNRSTHFENLPDAPLNQCLYVKNIHVLPSLYYAKEKLLCKKIPAVDKNKKHELERH